MNQILFGHLLNFDDIFSVLSFDHECGTFDLGHFTTSVFFPTTSSVRIVLYLYKRGNYCKEMLEL